MSEILKMRFLFSQLIVNDSGIWKCRNRDGKMKGTYWDDIEKVVLYKAFPWFINSIVEYAYENTSGNNEYEMLYGYIKIYFCREGKRYKMSLGTHNMFLSRYLNDDASRIAEKSVGKVVRSIRKHVSSTILINISIFNIFSGIYYMYNVRRMQRWMRKEELYYKSTVEH